MKKGDIVKVKDSSWAVEVREGKLEDAYHQRIGTTPSGNAKEWEVLAVDCKLPVNEVGERTGEVNDTIVRSLEGERVVFTQERFLVLQPSTFCPHCGRKIEKDC